jgi:hypothetical protein
MAVYTNNIEWRLFMYVHKTDRRLSTPTIQPWRLSTGEYYKLETVYRQVPGYLPPQYRLEASYTNNTGLRLS